MRELIDVAFADQTSYPALVSGDVGAIAIDHFWGKEDERQTLNLAQFLDEYPLVAGVQLSTSWLTAYRAYLAGLTQMEIVRVKDDAQYQSIVLGAVAGAAALVSAIPTTGTNTITLKNTGKLPQMYEPGATLFKIKVTSSAVGATVAGSFDVTVDLIYTDQFANIIEIESFTGGHKQGVIVDGQDWFIGTKLKSSKYLTLGGAMVGGALTGIAASQAAREYTLATTEPTALTAADLAAKYAEYFTDIENSEASILIDPGTVENTDANLLIATAKFRSDCVALIGYPLPDTFDKATIEAYKATLTPDKFSAFYAAREIFTVEGRDYFLNGIGGIAGAMASVAQSVNVNQLPSARSYGAFGGVLAESLSFTDILELHEIGINGVYATKQGARIFGLKSLHPRLTSYYSKFNVARVTARILKYAFGIAMDAIHTGNTESRRVLVQNLLNTDLNRLKPDSVRTQSTVQCDNLNNTDLKTNGGEILIIDYSIWFIKLIERVSFRITATDSSVTVQLNP